MAVEIECELRFVPKQQIDSHSFCSLLLQHCVQALTAADKDMRAKEPGGDENLSLCPANGFANLLKGVLAVHHPPTSAPDSHLKGGLAVFLHHRHPVLGRSLAGTQKLASIRSLRQAKSIAFSLRSDRLANQLHARVALQFQHARWLRKRRIVRREIPEKPIATHRPMRLPALLHRYVAEALSQKPFLLRRSTLQTTVRQRRQEIEEPKKIKNEMSVCFFFLRISKCKKNNWIRTNLPREASQNRNN